MPESETEMQWMRVWSKNGPANIIHKSDSFFPKMFEEKKFLEYTHLFSLHHLLVEEVRERALWIELPRPLSTHEHTVLTNQTSSADGYQRNAVTTHPLIQVKVSALYLSAHRDCPVD